MIITDFLKGLLQTNDGFVLKPVQSPPRGEREHNFFKHIFLSDSNELNEDEIELKNLLPTYRGSFMHNNSKDRASLKNDSIEQLDGYFCFSIVV